RRHDDRAGRVPRTEYDAGRLALWVRRRCARRFDQPGRGRSRRLRGRGDRESGAAPPRHRRFFRTRVEADLCAGADRRRADVPAQRPLRTQRGEPGMTTTPTSTVGARAGSASSQARSASGLRRYGVIALVIVAAAVVPLVAKSFVIFQLTQVMIYG